MTPPDEARSQINLLEGCGFEIPMRWTWASVVVILAQFCTDLDHRELAAQYYPRLQPVAGQVGVTGFALACYGSLALPCGQLAACLNRWEEAERYFALAMAMNERIGARPYLVRMWRAYTKMLLDRNMPDDQALAAKLIAQALAESDRLGMRREIERLDRLHYRLSELQATLLRRENFAPQIFASDRDCCTPRVPRQRAKDPMGPC